MMVIKPKHVGAVLM